VAVRFDASGDWYARTTGLGSVAAFSVSIWGKITTDRNTWSTFWSLTQSGGGQGVLAQTDSDGTSLIVYDQNAGQLGSARALTVGTWYWIGIVCDGANGAMHTKAVSDTAVTTTTWSTATTPRSIEVLRIGESIVGGEWLNGCVAAMKVWTAALTTDELTNEGAFYAPLRTADLRLWYPFLNAELVDYSGLGGDLTVGSSATATEAGPPILWTPQRSARRALVVADAATTGALAGTLPAVTGSIAAATTTDGALAGTLPTPTAALTGTVGTSGALAGELPLPTAALAADTPDLGGLAGQLPALTGAIAGDIRVEGALAGTLPALVAQIGGTGRPPPLIAGDPVQIRALVAGDPTHPQALYAGEPQAQVAVRAGAPTRI
jgi:concanavalin A-like lectin/glucanase superfamily protein